MTSSISQNNLQDITYGVELEFVFAFHQDELKKLLRDKEEIIKNVPLFDRKRLTRIPEDQLPNHVSAKCLGIPHCVHRICNWES